MLERAGRHRQGPDAARAGEDARASSRTGRWRRMSAATGSRALGRRRRRLRCSARCPTTSAPASRRHLDAAPACRDEVAELRVAADALPRAAPPVRAAARAEGAGSWPWSSARPSCCAPPGPQADRAAPAAAPRAPRLRGWPRRAGRVAPPRCGARRRRRRRRRCSAARRATGGAQTVDRPGAAARRARRRSRSTARRATLRRPAGCRRRRRAASTRCGSKRGGDAPEPTDALFTSRARRLGDVARAGRSTASTGAGHRRADGRQRRRRRAADRRAAGLAAYGRAPRRRAASVARRDGHLLPPPRPRDRASPARTAAGRSARTA